jgi:hypothetical protein
VAGRVNLPLFSRTLTQTVLFHIDSNGLSFLGYHTAATLLFRICLLYPRRWTSELVSVQTQLANVPLPFSRWLSLLCINNYTYLYFLGDILVSDAFETNGWEYRDM